MPQTRLTVLEKPPRTPAALPMRARLSNEWSPKAERHNYTIRAVQQEVDFGNAKASRLANTECAAYDTYAMPHAAISTRLSTVTLSACVARLFTGRMTSQYAPTAAGVITAAINPP